MPSKCPPRPGTLAHHVPCADNNPHTATEAASWLHGTKAGATDTKQTESFSGSGAQTSEPLPKSAADCWLRPLPRESDAHLKHSVLCPSVRTSRSCVLGFCSPETCKGNVRAQAAGTGWKLFQKRQEGKSLCHRGVVGAKGQLWSLFITKLSAPASLWKSRPTIAQVVK